MIQSIFVKGPSIRPTVNDLIQEQFFTRGYTLPSLPTSCLLMAPHFGVTEQTFAIKREPLTQLNICNTPNSPKRPTSHEQNVRLTTKIFPFSESYNFLCALKSQSSGYQTFR